MAWSRHREDDGVIVWVGEDFIVDPWWQYRRINRIAWLLCAPFLMFTLGWGGMVALVMAWSHLPFYAMGGRGNFEAVVNLFCLGVTAWFLCWALFKSVKWELPAPFISRTWALASTANVLCYEAEKFDPPLDPWGVCRSGPKWTIALDSVSRVESGLTIEWQPAREYEGGSDSPFKHQPIPRYEYQTFLFLNDGSRRVILTANADREECGTLAASVREWLEEARARSQNLIVHGVDEGFAM